MIIKLTQAGTNIWEPIYLNTDHIAGFRTTTLTTRPPGENSYTRELIKTPATLIWDESGNDDTGCFYVQESCDLIWKMIEREKQE